MKQTREQSAQQDRQDRHTENRTTNSHARAILTLGTRRQLTRRDRLHQPDDEAAVPHRGVDLGDLGQTLEVTRGGVLILELVVGVESVGGTLLGS